MRVELGMAAATAGLGRQALGLSIVPHQDHDKRNRHPKMCRRRTPRVASLDKPHNTFTQIERIGLGYGKSPPTGSES